MLSCAFLVVMDGQKHIQTINPLALQVVSPSSLSAAKVKEIERSDIPFLLPALLDLRKYKERNEVAPPLMPRIHHQIPGTILLMTAPCRPLLPHGPSQHGPLEMEVTSRWVLPTAFCLFFP